MDKRKNIRVDYSTTVEIQELGIHDKSVLTANTKSLSIGGILLDSKESLEVGSKIQINIALDRDNPLLIIGNVVNSTEAGPGNYEIGISFLDSDKALKNEISSYLIKHLSDLPAKAH
jgi:c-di-GMP-binding flagellar brake protein YcgR